MLPFKYAGNIDLPLDDNSSLQIIFMKIVNAHTMRNDLVVVVVSLGKI